MAAAVVAAATILGALVMDAHARGSVERVLLCSASGGFTTVLAPLEGAAWKTADLSGAVWYLIADRATACDSARRLLPELSRRTASQGTAGRVVFPLSGGWNCAASRTTLQAGCSRLVKGRERYVIVIAATGAAGELTARILLDGDADARSFAPAPHAGPPSEPAPRAAPGEECAPARGRVWVLEIGTRRIEGSTWKVGAVGGLSCLAARAWVDDLTARMPGGAGRRLVDFDGGDGWRCRTSDPPLLLGVCARSSGARGPLDFRGVVVAPSTRAQPSLSTLPLTIEEAVNAISDSRPEPRNETRPALCDDAHFAGKRWVVGAASGTRWLIAQRGAYPCQLALAAARTVLLDWALGEPGTRMTAGVAGRWTCTRMPDSGLRCYGFGPFSRYKLALVPYLPGRTHQQNVDAAVAAAR